MRIPWKHPTPGQSPVSPPSNSIAHARQAAYFAAGIEMPYWHPARRLAPEPSPTRWQRLGWWCATRWRGLVQAGRRFWQQHRKTVTGLGRVLAGLATVAGAVVAFIAYIDPP